MSTYKVVFWGGIQADQEQSEVIRRFAKRFKLSDRKQLATLFSGRILTLRAGLSDYTAQKIATALRELGAECRVEPELNIKWGRAVNNEDRYPSGLATRKREAERRPALTIPAANTANHAA